MSYEQPENDAVDFSLESYTPPGNDAVDFNLEEGATAETKDPIEGVSIPTSPVDLPLGLDLPTRPLSLSNMNTGIALFIVGVLTVTGGAAAAVRNYVAGMSWGVAILLLIASGLLGIGLEAFWTAVMATVLMLMVGFALGWLQ